MTEDTHAKRYERLKYLLSKSKLYTQYLVGRMKKQKEEEAAKREEIVKRQQKKAEMSQGEMSPKPNGSQIEQVHYFYPTFT